MSESPRPDHLRVEHLATAFGIDTTRPRLSWWLPDGAGQQFGYRIRTDNGWDSGHVTSHESVLVGYGGPPLASGERVTWQRAVTHRRGRPDRRAVGRPAPPARRVERSRLRRGRLGAGQRHRRRRRARPRSPRAASWPR